MSPFKHASTLGMEWICWELTRTRFSDASLMKLIPLTQGYFAKVSDRDFSELRKYKWQVHRRKNSEILYAQRHFRDPITGKRRAVYMHRQIRGFPIGLDVDHKDRDGLNNQRRNLRNATRSQNLANSQGRRARPFKGVFRKRNKWGVQIRKNGRRIYCGVRDTQEEAHALYVSEARKIHGRFMRAE